MGQAQRACNTKPHNGLSPRSQRLLAVAILLVGIAVILVIATRGGEQSTGNESVAAGENGEGASGSPGAKDPVEDKPDETVRFTVAATGDFLIHSPVYYRALSNGGGRRYNFKPMFRYIKPYINGADLAICHFETPMTGGALSGYPMFNVPQGLAKDAKKTGWDLCDTASNHTLDRGQGGINATIGAIRRAGLKSTGSARSLKGRRKIAMAKVKGVKVALLAFTESTNGIPLPSPFSVNLMEAKRVLAYARQAKRQGADVVIVNLHWGNEYQHRTNPKQRRIAGQLTRSPNIDAIIGQHVHVVQPIKRMNGKYVVFGEGNLISNQSAACCAPGSQDGIIALLDFKAQGDEVKVERVRYVPTWVRRTDYAVLPVGKALRMKLANPTLLRASYNRTVSVIGRKKGVSPVPNLRR